MLPRRRLLRPATLLLLGVLPALIAVRGTTEEGHRQLGTGCLFVLVSDSATGKPVGYANTSAIGLRKGCMADSFGRCLMCGLPEGKVALRTLALAYSQRSDTVVVARDHTGTLRVALKRRHINVGETLLVAPRRGSVR
jgi:hypothetical protein